MSLRMTKAAAQKYLQKQKPNTFITLRREQFDELALMLDVKSVRLRDGGTYCVLCDELILRVGATDHKPDCPLHLISKLEKV